MELTFRALTDDTNVLGRGMERLLFRPWGSYGGQAGLPGALIVNRGRPDERRLGKIDVLNVNAGDTVTFLTPERVVGAIRINEIQTPFCATFWMVLSRATPLIPIMAW